MRRAMETNVKVETGKRQLGKGVVDACGEKVRAVGVRATTTVSSEGQERKWRLGWKAWAEERPC